MTVAIGPSKLRSLNIVNTSAVLNPLNECSIIQLYSVLWVTSTLKEGDNCLP